MMRHVFFFTEFIKSDLLLLATKIPFDAKPSNKLFPVLETKYNWIQKKQLTEWKKKGKKKYTRSVAAEILFLSRPVFKRDSVQQSICQHV